jgi:Tfp pilus tip-associated adhesin PilY1
MEHSILGTPTLFDLNFDGFADVLYLGDRGGRLFKWVITDVGVDNVAAGLGARTQAAWKFKQIFQADINTTGGVIYWRER